MFITYETSKTFMDLSVQNKLLKAKNGGFSLTSLNKYNLPKINQKDSKSNESEEMWNYKDLVIQIVYSQQ